MHPLIYAAIIFLVIYIGLCFVAYFIQAFFFFHPEKLPQSFQFISKYEIPMEEIFIDLGDGTKINALHYTIPNSKGVVFYFKGNTKSIKGWGKFSKDFIGKNYDFFMIDYPGFGKSKGKRTENRIYNVGQHCYKWLCEKYPEDKIIIYGRSMGSGFAARIASWNRPKSLILDSGFYSFYHLAQRFVPVLPMKWIIRYKIPTFEFLKSMKCPVYFIHGDKDWLIPYRYSVKMNRENPNNSTLFTIEGAKHNDLPSYSKYHKVLYRILNNNNPNNQ
ncbi:MAG: alpha/beta hydrolase [Bacteroidia bacterium]|nr:alpha/beta hydrolase [Bacteroidia bacterium]NNC86416.1 alpha/beta hydrolase [Bacteroidia bacterium]